MSIGNRTAASPPATNFIIQKNLRTIQQRLSSDNIPMAAITSPFPILAEGAHVLFQASAAPPAFTSVTSMLCKFQSLFIFAELKCKLPRCTTRRAGRRRQRDLRSSALHIIFTLFSLQRRKACLKRGWDRHQLLVREKAAVLVCSINDNYCQDVCDLTNNGVINKQTLFPGPAWMPIERGPFTFMVKEESSAPASGVAGATAMT